MLRSNSRPNPTCVGEFVCLVCFLVCCRLLLRNSATHFTLISLKLVWPREHQVGTHSLITNKYVTFCLLLLYPDYSITLNVIGGGDYFQVLVSTVR